MMRRVALLALAAEVSAQTESFHCNATTFRDLDLCMPMAADVSVDTTNGTVIGKLGPDGVSRFYGVEFADSTGTGANGPRFKYPKPLGTWFGTPKQAKVISTCDMTEDCLSLDIATPATIANGAASGSQFPVFVYFTGGGFMQVGNDPGPIMDMAYHARFGLDPTDPNSPGKAVQVYINYRLAMLGWMSHPGFGLGNGNFGLADGIEGLKWVQANIARFGGNPGMVSIQGASAGGGYTSLILASPLSVGLIHGVFSMSPYVSYHPAFYSQNMRFEIGMMYAKAVGCSSDFVVPSGVDATTQADCLMAKDAEEMFPGWTTNPNLLAAAVGFSAAPFTADIQNEFATYKSAPYISEIFTFNFAVAPVVDGYVLDMPPLQAYASGRNKDVTLIMGHQANEYSSPLFSSPNTLVSAEVFNHQYQIGIKDLPVTASMMDMYLAINAAPNIHTVTSVAYPGFGSSNVSVMPSSAWQTNIQSSTDVFFTWSIQSATDAAIAGGNTKVYKLLNLMGAPASLEAMFGADIFRSQTGAFHASEDNLNMGNYIWSAGFLAGSMGMYGVTPFSPTEIAAAKAMMTHWKNVVMGNKPDATGVTWPANTDAYMVYGTAFTAGAAFGPCIRIHASEAGCVTETTAPFRASQIAYFNDPDNFVAPTTPPSASCAVPWLESDGGATGLVSGSFGLTLPLSLGAAGSEGYAAGPEYSCSSCTCSAARKLLFGASSVPTQVCSCA